MSVIMLGDPISKSKNMDMLFSQEGKLRSDTLIGNQVYT